MLPIDRTTLGQIYCLHFSHPLGNTSKPRGMARHYVGWALDAEQRIAQHLAGQSGVAIVAAALEAGITLTPYVLGIASKNVEHTLKHKIKNITPYCPCCARLSGRAPRALPCSADQLVLPLFDDDWPDAPAEQRADWLEFKTLQQWRASRAGLTSAIDLAIVDTCL